MRDAEEFAKRMMPALSNRIQSLAENEVQDRNYYEKKFKEFGYDLSLPSNWEIEEASGFLEKWESIGIKAKISIVYADAINITIDHKDTGEFFLTVFKFKKKKFLFPKQYFVCWQSVIPLQRIEISDAEREDNVLEKFWISKSINNLFVDYLSILIGDIDGFSSLEEGLKSIE